MNSSFSFSRFGREEAHQQPAMIGVLRRIERQDLVAHGQPVAVLLDEIADVVTL